MEGQFEFLIERNEYVTNDAPTFIQNAWKKAKQDRKREFTEKQNLPYEKKITRL